MKTDIYIIYNVSTNKVIKTFNWFGQADDFIKHSDGKLACLNRTHPINKDKLKDLKGLI